MLPADVRQLLEVVEHRVRISLLRLHVQVGVFVVHADPGLGFWQREAGVARIVPHHRPASIVAAFQPDDRHYVRHIGFCRGIH